MWVMVFFDLPTDTKKEVKAATEFRKQLMSDGFVMFQYSSLCKCGECGCPHKEGKVFPSAQRESWNSPHNRQAVRRNGTLQLAEIRKSSRRRHPVGIVLKTRTPKSKNPAKAGFLILEHLS